MSYADSEKLWFIILHRVSKCPVVDSYKKMPPHFLCFIFLDRPQQAAQPPATLACLASAEVTEHI